jgi:hypothetical protein
MTYMTLEIVVILDIIKILGNEYRILKIEHFQQMIEFFTYYKFCRFLKRFITADLQLVIVVSDFTICIT